MGASKRFGIILALAVLSATAAAETAAAAPVTFDRIDGAAGSGGARHPAAEMGIEFRDSMAMFTVWAWMSAACDPGENEAEWPPVKRYVRRRLLERLDPGLLGELRDGFAVRDDRMFNYWASIWPIFLTEPPEMELDLSGLSAPGEVDSRALAATRRRFGEMANLLPLLNRFWREADIAGLRRECDRWYEPAIAFYREETAKAIDGALDYLRMGPASEFFPGPVVMFPNLIGVPGAAMGPSFAGVKYDVECPPEGVESIVITPHEYIHDMVGGLTLCEANRERIESLAAAVADDYAGTPAAEYYPDPVQWFDECLVRAIDFTVRLGWRTPEEREELERAIAGQAKKGFVLAAPMRESLAAFENSDVPFAQWFPLMLEDLAAAAVPVPEA